MLPLDQLVRTNYVNGMKFNPSLVDLTDRYFDERLSLLSVATLGSGVFLGYKQSLRLEIEGMLLVVKPGAALDTQGNLIHIPVSTSILEDLSTRQFQDGSTVYILLKYQEKLDDLRPARNEELNVNYQKVSGYDIRLDHERDPGAIELGRIRIDHQGSDQIRLPRNFSNTKANEIDLNFVSKIENRFCALLEEEIVQVSDTLEHYADYMLEASVKTNSHVCAIAASLAYALESRSRSGEMSRHSLYEGVENLIRIGRKLQIEKPAVIETAYWKNLMRLEKLYMHETEVASHPVYYDSMALENTDSFFSKVLYHIEAASKSEIDWLEEIKLEALPQKEEFILVGRASDCHIIVDQDEIDPYHARIAPFKHGFFLEDLESEEGTYVNSVRLMRGVKQFITPSDEVMLGRHYKINLNDERIQNLSSERAG